MSYATIRFFCEDIVFNLPSSGSVSEWILNVILLESYSLSELNIIFCSDSYLLEINRNYLNHDYFTDVITFDNSDTKQSIESDIFISIDRVTDNSINFAVNFIDELHRVIIHGVLHLLGYNDTSNDEENIIRTKENYYLSLRSFNCST